MVSQMAPSIRERAAERPTWGATQLDDSLAERFYSFLALPDGELERALAHFIRTEDELPAPARYEAALGRLRAWLELDREDARIIARAYDRALAALPSGFAERRLEAERAVIMNGMTFAEFRALADFLPWLRAPEYLVPDTPELAVEEALAVA